MNTIRYTLLSDGSSDRMLMPILAWLLHHHCSGYTVESDWADLGRLPRPPKTLQDRIRIALEFYPCDLLFIHRDAEKESFETRHAQITGALNGLTAPPAVCVIPVRMQEAWLLFDEAAIRKAAGNPAGRSKFVLPEFGSMEKLPDPKQALFDLICTASGFTGSRLKKLKIGLRRAVHQVSRNIDDFSPLRNLAAFNRLEQELLTVVQQQGWNR